MNHSKKIWQWMSEGREQILNKKFRQDLHKTWQEDASVSSGDDLPVDEGQLWKKLQQQIIRESLTVLASQKTPVPKRGRMLALAFAVAAMALFMVPFPKPWTAPAVNPQASSPAASYDLTRPLDHFLVSDRLTRHPLQSDHWTVNQRCDQTRQSCLVSVFL